MNKLSFRTESGVIRFAVDEYDGCLYIEVSNSLDNEYSYSIIKQEDAIKLREWLDKEVY